MNDDEILNSLGKILDKEELLKLTDSEKLEIRIPNKIQMMIRNAKRKQDDLKNNSQGILDKLTDILIPENSTPTLSFGADGTEERDIDDALKEELNDDEPEINK